METVQFMNMCMIEDGDKVVVIERLKKVWPGIAFPGGDCVIIMTGAYNADKSRI